MKGIDISKYQSKADFAKVKQQGYEFVIIRVGHRGYLYKSIVLDPKFVEHTTNAIAHNVPYGVYFLTQAVNEAEAREEARFCIEQVKKLSVPPSYPIYIDTEWSNSPTRTGRHDLINKTTRTAVCKAFCNELEQNGYYAGIYASTSWFYERLNDKDLIAYDKWVAQYNTKCTYNGSYGMWQYGGSQNYLNSVKVEGVSSAACDQNIAYKNYPYIMRANGLNGWKKTEQKEEVKKTTVYSVTTDYMSTGDYNTISTKLNELKIPFEKTEKLI